MNRNIYSNKIDLSTTEGLETIVKAVFGSLPYAFEQVDKNRLIQAIEDTVSYDNDQLTADYIYIKVCQRALEDFEKKITSLDYLDGYLDTEFDNLAAWEQKKLNNLFNFKARGYFNILECFEIEANDMASRCTMTGTFDFLDSINVHGAFYVIHRHTRLFEDLEEECGAEYKNYYAIAEDEDYRENSIQDYKALFEFDRLNAGEFFKKLDELSDAGIYEYAGLEIWNERIVTRFYEKDGVIHIADTCDVYDSEGQLIATLLKKSDGNIVEVNE